MRNFAISKLLIANVYSGIPWDKYETISLERG